MTTAKLASPLDGLIESMTKMLDKNLETHCFEFVRANMVTDTEHFKRTDLHFEADGLHAIYKCNIDGRKYDVCIKALK